MGLGHAASRHRENQEELMTAGLQSDAGPPEPWELSRIIAVYYVGMLTHTDSMRIYPRGAL